MFVRKKVCEVESRGVKYHEITLVNQQQTKLILRLPTINECLAYSQLKNDLLGVMFSMEEAEERGDKLENYDTY